MEWSDTAIILSARPHGERAAIVNLISAQHGRWQGRINAAQLGKKPWLCAGTAVQAAWRARLEDQLGTFVLEPLHHTAAHVFDEPVALLALDYMCMLTADVTPERMPLPILFEALYTALGAVGQSPTVIDYERKLLDVMGYGLDVSRCAVTGTTDNLTHISPTTGRAVCATEAEPYKDRLLPLPVYWQGSGAVPSATDIVNAARVTGHFLAQHFYPPPRQLPPQRGQLVNYS